MGANSEAKAPRRAVQPSQLEDHMSSQHTEVERRLGVKK